MEFKSALLKSNEEGEKTSRQNLMKEDQYLRLKENGKALSIH